MMVLVAGLPRSGSTLLLNILGQNPNFHVGPTSGLLETLLLIKNNWENNQLHRTIPTDISRNRLHNVLNGIINGYYADTTGVIFDKSRNWPNHLEMIEWITGTDAKVLIVLRDVHEILASFEKLWRRNTAYRQLIQETEGSFQTVQDRCNVWMHPKQPVGFAINTISDAKLRGFSNRMFYVNYKDLIDFPQATILSIYLWLQVPIFEHRFDKINQITFENDEVHRITGLHDIKPTIQCPETTWEAVLGRGIKIEPL